MNMLLTITLGPRHNVARGHDRGATNETVPEGRSPITHTCILEFKPSHLSTPSILEADSGNSKICRRTCLIVTALDLGIDVL